MAERVAEWGFNGSNINDGIQVMQLAHPTDNSRHNVQIVFIGVIKTRSINEGKNSGGPILQRFRFGSGLVWCQFAEIRELHFRYRFILKIHELVSFQRDRECVLTY